MGRTGEILSCPWHGWEYDVRTGRSLCEPNKVWVEEEWVWVEIADE